MAIIVIFDPNATPNAVLSVDHSGSSDQFVGRSDALINPDISGLSGVPVRHWKHVGGAVVEMTAQEKTDVDAAIVAAAIALMRSGGKSLIDAASDIGIVQRAAADIMRDEINILRERDRDRAADVAAATTLADLKVRWAARSTLADRTLVQLRTSILNRIDSGTVDS